MTAITPLTDEDPFGTSDWRAAGWEDMARNAKTGDAFRGLRKDGTWWSITVRVLEGVREGRHYCRFIYAGWHENGRDCETSWECFATLCSQIESVPNAASDLSAQGANSTTK